MTRPDFEQLAQDYLDFVKKGYRVVFPIPDNASEDEILRGSRSWPGPMDISSPLGEVDRAYFPQLIEAIAGLVKQQYNSATARALGYRLCIWMMGSDGRTPALLEGNYGQCMAAIEQNLDMSGMKPTIRPNWFDVGEESRLDDARAMAHTYMSANSLFWPLYMESGNLLERSLGTMANIKPADLKPSYVHQYRYDRLMEMAADVPMFMTVAMKLCPVDDTNARNIFQVLGLLEQWGAEEPNDVEADKLKQWREAADPAHKLNPTQILGKARLDKMALAAISKEAAQPQPSKAGKTPKM